MCLYLHIQNIYTKLTTLLPLTAPTFSMLIKSLGQFSGTLVYGGLRGGRGRGGGRGEKDREGVRTCELRRKRKGKRETPGKAREKGRDRRKW